MPGAQMRSSSAGARPKAKKPPTRVARPPAASSSTATAKAASNDKSKTPAMAKLTNVPAHGAADGKKKAAGGAATKPATSKGIARPTPRAVATPRVDTGARRPSTSASTGVNSAPKVPGKKAAVRRASPRPKNPSKKSAKVQQASAQATALASDIALPPALRLSASGSFNKPNPDGPDVQGTIGWTADTKVDSIATLNNTLTTVGGTASSGGSPQMGVMPVPSITFETVEVTSPAEASLLGSPQRASEKSPAGSPQHEHLGAVPQGYTAFQDSPPGSPESAAAAATSGTGTSGTPSQPSMPGPPPGSPKHTPRDRIRSAAGGMYANLGLDLTNPKGQVFTTATRRASASGSPNGPSVVAGRRLSTGVGFAGGRRLSSRGNSPEVGDAVYGTARRTSRTYANGTARRRSSNPEALANVAMFQEIHAFVENNQGCQDKEWNMASPARSPVTTMPKGGSQTYAEGVPGGGAPQFGVPRSPRAGPPRSPRSPGTPGSAQGGARSPKSPAPMSAFDLALRSPSAKPVSPATASLQARSPPMRSPAEEYLEQLNRRKSVVVKDAHVDLKKERQLNRERDRKDRELAQAFLRRGESRRKSVAAIDTQNSDDDEGEMWASQLSHHDMVDQGLLANPRFEQYCERFLDGDIPPDTVWRSPITPAVEPIDPPPLPLISAFA